MSTECAQTSRPMLPWLIAASAPFALANAAFSTIAPLWVTEDLGGGAADWAQLRSLRFMGTFAGSIAIGVASSRWPSRPLLLASLAASALTMGLLSYGIAVAWLMPALGASISAAFVAFNSLIQSSSTQQAAANAWYRGTGATMAVLAPFAAMAAASGSGSLTGAVAAASATLGMAALIMFAYPVASSEQARSGVGWRGYLQALCNPQLLRFIVVGEIAGLASEALAVFAAIRMTNDLGLSVGAFAVCAGAGGAAGVIAIVASGRFAASHPAPRVLAFLALAAGVSSIVFAQIDHPLTAVGAFMAATAAATAWGVPLSLGLARRGSALPMDCVFAAHKTLQSAAIAVTAAVLSVMEPTFGIRGVICVCGIATLLSAAVLFSMRDPDVN